MNKFKKVIASILCLNIILSSSPVMLFAVDPAPAVTTNITGVTGNNGVYDITAQSVVNDTGYRQYTNFTLANTDTANLIFTKDNANFARFINMVDNRVEINGLLNTVDGNGAFYNGHAIFVTPGGIVIGADGVLNVGKLSMISTTGAAYNSYKGNTSQGNYNALITNKDGDIIINGKILTTAPSGTDPAAEIYAGNITVEKKSESAETTTKESVGVFAYNDTENERTSYTSRETAAAKFNSLVNAEVKTATSSSVDTEGNVVLTNTKLEAKDTVTINNEAVYKATQYKKIGTDYVLVDFDPNAQSTDDTPRNVSTTVLLDNTSISGATVNVTATSTASGEANLFNGTGSSWSVIWDKLLAAIDVSDSKLAEEVESLFSATGYTYYVGARSLSEVLVRNNSIIKTTGDLNVSTNATATFKLDNQAKENTQKIRDFLFAFGTETKSKISIDGSTVEADGNTNINAQSSNSFLRKDETLGGTFRTGGLLSFGNNSKKSADVFNFSYFNFSTVANTGVDIKNSSTVKGAGTGFNSTANVRNDIWINNTDTIGVTEGERSDNGNGATVAVIVNNAKIDNKVSVENSEVEAKTGDLAINANTNESITTKNLVITTTADKKEPTNVDDGQPIEEEPVNNANGPLMMSTNNSGGPLDLFSNLYNDNKPKIQSALSSLLAKVGSKAFNYLRDKVSGVLPENSFKLGGVATLNSVDNNQGITISNSTIKAGQSLVINSTLNLVHSNIAVGDAEKGEVNTVGIGAAFVLDDIDNENLITVNGGSKLSAGRNIDVDALTKMPGAGENGKIEFGPANNLLKLTIDFSVGDISISKPDISAAKLKDWLGKNAIDTKKWTPGLAVSGLFENQVASFSKSMDSKVDVAVSVLAAKADNNTKVDIQSSTLTSDSGSIDINAVNKVQSNTALGIRDLIWTTQNYPSLDDFFNSDGLGGNVFYRDSNNEAQVNIYKSTVTASNGDVNIGSANEQLYINLLKLGARGNEYAEVTGSVNVQNLDGTTEVNVSGIENDESSITGRNVRIAAGEAGSTNDGVTVIDVNGSYSSNTEGGVAVGAAVNVWDIDREVKAVVDHASVTSTTGNTAVKATTQDNIIEFALAGAYSGNGAEDIAGSKETNAPNSENSIIRKAESRANNASANRVTVDIDGEDAGEGDEGAAPAASAEHASDIAGEPGHRQQFSLSGAGSVNIVMDDTDVIADVTNSTIDSAGTTDVTATMDNLSIFGAGGISKSTKIGAGAAANLYLRNDKERDQSKNYVRASVEDSTVSSGGAVSVRAKDNTDVYSFAAGVGIVSSGESPSITLGGSFDYNTIKPYVDAHVKNATVSGKNQSNKSDVLVNAEASTFTLGFSGGFTSDTTPGLSIGASIAATADRMGSTIKSYILDSTLDTNIGKVSVLSKATNTIYGIGVSAAVTTKSTSDFKFDGSLGIVVLENNISSEIKNSTVNADGDVNVSADNSAEAVNLEGTVQFSGSSDTGLGVNGAVVIDKQSNTVNSEITNSNRNKTVTSTGKINVVSNSYEQLNAVPITASIANSGLESLSSVVVNLVDNKVKSSVIGTLTAGDDVTIRANDDTFLLTRGGTVGVNKSTASAGANVVLDFSVNYNKVAKTVDASVKGATINTPGDLSVNATSVDAIGASDGKKDEEELLKKNADDYYSALKVEKDFSKWNMFYTLGTSLSSSITASGTVIIDNIKNDVNASIGAEWYDGWSSINKSTINARNVNVLASDTGINNVFAGAVAGTIGDKYAASLGFQVIWARNASKVRATIKQNTKVTAEDKTDIRAVSDKDTNLVVVAASGNTGKGLSLAANGIYSRNKDNVYAGVDYSTVDAGSLDINADNKEDIVKVMVGVGASETVALTVEPIIDKQEGKVRSFVNIDTGASLNLEERAEFYFDYSQKTSLFSNADRSYASKLVTTKGDISVNSNNIIDTTDVIVGISGAQYVAGTGLGISHTFNDYVLTRINSAVINSAGELAFSADNKIDVDNWSMGAAAAVQGAAAAANVISNTIKSYTIFQMYSNETSSVRDFKVNVTLDENVSNNAAALGATYEGGSLGLNLIFNNFKEYTEIEQITNSVNNADRETTVAFKMAVNRVLANRTILAAANLIGVAANGAAVKTKSSSMTKAFADTSIYTKGDVELSVEDKMKVSDISVDANVGGVGAGIGVNVFLLSNKGSAYAYLRRDITARNVAVNSLVRQSYDQVNVGLSSGIGVIGVNVSNIKMGNTLVPDLSGTDIYTTYEKKATDQLQAQFGDVALDETVNTYEGSHALLGDFNQYFGNTLNASGDVKVNARTEIDGVNLTNVNVSGSGVNVGVGVHSINLKHATTAEILGQNINARNVEVSASHKDNTKLTSVGVGVSLAKIAVGANSYNNESITKSFIDSSTINTANGAVSVLSSVDTKASTNNVEISLSGAETNVLSHELVDSAKAESYIIGETTINADTLNIRSSGAMDVSGGSTAVTVSVVPISIDNNKIEGKAELSALIRNGGGRKQGNTEINVNHLNIVTDYSKMKASAKNNVVTISAAEVSVFKDTVLLHPVFTSGIDGTGTGEGSITINNAGTTIIETAKPTNSDNEFMLASASIGGVNISIIDLYGGTTAKAKSETESNTILKATDFHHNASDLVVNAYLKTKVKANADSNSFSAAGVNYVVSEGISQSNLDIATAGELFFEGKVKFNTFHTALTDVDLDSIGASLLSVNVFKINSAMEANTTTHLSGKLNAREIEANLNTERTGKLSSSYNGAEAIGYTGFSAENKLSGSSDILLSGLTLTANRFVINNITTNTTDDVSHNNSGGLFDFGKGSYRNDYSTTSKIRIENKSVISVTGDIDLIVRSNNIIKDSSSNISGGFVAFKKNDYSRSFTSGTLIKVNDSSISSKNLNMSATSDMSTDKKETIKYTASGGGFIVGDSIKLSTTLNQNNSVTIENKSSIKTEGNTAITTAANFFYKQYVSSKDDGFMAWPEAKSSLTSKNTNTVTVKGESTVEADKELTVNFDASGDLYTKTFAKARNIGSKVKSTANVTLTVNNNLNVGDETTDSTDFTKNKLHGGDYVGVSFMGNSTSNVDHESYAQCNAVAPDTSQKGTSKKNVTNTFNLYKNGSLETNKDVEVVFSLGEGSVTSWNHYKRVYYVLFGYTRKKSYNHNVEVSHTPVFNMAGAISAGYSDSWELEIAADESIVKSVGFRSSAFQYVDAKDAQDLKNQRVGIIKEELTIAQAYLSMAKVLRGLANQLVLNVDRDLELLDQVSADVAAETHSMTEKTAEELRVQINNVRREMFAEEYARISGESIDYAKTQYDAVVAAYEANRGADTDPTFRFDEMDEYVSEYVTDSNYKDAYKYSGDIIEDRLFVVTVAAERDAEPNTNQNTEQNAEPEKIPFDVQLIYYNDGTEYFAVYGAEPGTSTGEALDIAKTNLNGELDSLRAQVAGYDKEIELYNAQVVGIQSRLNLAEAISPEEYEKRYGLYSIVFDDIYLTSKGRITIKGVDESNEPTSDDYPADLDPNPDVSSGSLRIKGPGNSQPLQFYVGTGGVKVTNYSNRTLVFDDVSVKGNTRDDKLIINGKIRNDLVIQPSSTGPLIVGITIQNLMDVTHPFYSNETGHPLSHLNNIVVNGLLYTDGDQITVTSQSGNVRIESLNYVEGRDVNISAEQGNLIVGGIATSQDGPVVFTLDANRTMVAGKLLKINADNITINGSLYAGVNQKTFTMEEGEPELEMDPVTGKNILVKQAGNNIKALYVKGRYLLFSQRETDGSVQFAAVTNSEANPEFTLGANASIVINHGYSNIYVNNQNEKEIVINNIENTRNADSIYPALSIGTQVIDEFNKVTINRQDKAIVLLGTEQNITTDGKILNSYQRDENGDLTIDNTSGGYVQVTNYGESGTINIGKVGEGEPAITSGGHVSIFNNHNGNISIIGGVKTPDVKLSQPSVSEDSSLIGDISTERLTLYSANQNVRVENTNITTYAQFLMPGKRIEVDNEDITIEKNVNAKLYTAIAGPFSMQTNVTNKVVTTAPVVYSRGDIVIKNMLGYHTFETLSYSEANTMDREARTLKVRVPSFMESIISADTNLIEIEEE